MRYIAGDLDNSTRPGWTCEIFLGLARLRAGSLGFELNHENGSGIGMGCVNCPVPRGPVSTLGIFFSFSESRTSTTRTIQPVRGTGSKVYESS